MLWSIWGFFLVDIKILAFHNGIPKPSYRQEEKKQILKETSLVNVHCL